MVRTLVIVNCEFCGNNTTITLGSYNYGVKHGQKYWFCNRKCKANFPKFKERNKEYRDKIAKTLKGRKTGIVPETAFKKGHTINKGRIPTVETRKKISMLAKKGKDSHLWNGGTTNLNLSIRRSFETRLWRFAVFSRDNFTCQYCGTKSGNGKSIILEAHHIKPFKNIIKENNILTLENAYSCEQLWDINNGITYCKDCHIKLDKYRGKRGKSK